LSEFEPSLPEHHPVNHLKPGNSDVDLIQILLRLPPVLDTVEYQLYSIHWVQASRDLKGVLIVALTLDQVCEIPPFEENDQGEEVIVGVEA
jgi:hypothetical protein